MVDPNDIYTRFTFTSKGWVTVSKEGYSYKLSLHVTPTDDILTAEGAIYKTAKEAALKLAQVYGQELNRLMREAGG